MPQATARCRVAAREFIGARAILRHGLLFLFGLLVLAGCKKQIEPANPAASQSDKAARSAVPLRVWFASDEIGEGLGDRALIQRQWQATSERPLELLMLNSRALLDYEKCDCDVVVYPAHVIGDLLDRQWLVELPASLTPARLSTGSAMAGEAAGQASHNKSSTPPGQASGGELAGSAAVTGDEGTTALQPAAWIDQTRYGRSLWGVSLGLTAPVVMANFELRAPGADGRALADIQDPQAYWQAAIEALSAKASGKTNDHPALAEEASSAVCDRFLVIVMSIIRRESRFGVLFDPETLKARLGEQEFIAAAEILLQLHRLNATPQAIAGSDQAAWQALSSQEPCLSIGLPPLPSAEIDKATSIASSLPPPSPGLAGARSTMSDRTNGWNSGHGLVASLTTQCRQTSQAIEFTRWLASESSRGALARSLHGISAPTIHPPGSSAWQAQRLEQRIAQQPRLPAEPRLPGSVEYRDALYLALVDMLSGQRDPKAALEAAAAQWDEITATRDQAKLRTSYEASLGL